MPDELREALERAYDEDTKETSDETARHDDGQPPVPDAGDGTPAGDSGAAASEGAAGAGESGSGSSKAEGDTPGAETPSGEETPDGGAKFLPPEGETPGDDKGTPSPETVGEKVPVAWRGAAKQHWTELPAEVRQEVIRREREVDEVLHESASARRFQQEFEQTVKPFESFMAADGVNALQATRNLMRTAATLQVGNPQQKAAVAYDIIKRYAIDINTLDSMLAGETPAPAASRAGNGGAPAGDSTLRYIDQRLAPVNQFIQGLQGAQQQRQEALDKEVDAEFEAFAADPENIFLEDVRDVMADLLQTAAQHNRKMTFKEAYALAVNMDPEKARIQNQRNAARTAGARQQSLAQKKAAAASVQGTSVTPSPAVPTDLRGQINAAWDAHGGGT